MVITYHGGQCFKVTFGDTTLAFDPISKKSSLTPAKFGADIAFVSMRHPDFNGVEQAMHGGKAPFVIDGPGEYEVGEVTARGYGVKNTYDKEERFNTIYQVSLEGMNLVFLGALDDPEIDAKILGALSDIDILFVPIGGDEVLEVPQASKLGVKLEAKAIIPMHYDPSALKASLKEEGSDATAQDKFTVKKKDLGAMNGTIVVLK